MRRNLHRAPWLILTLWLAWAHAGPGLAQNSPKSQPGPVANSKATLLPPVPVEVELLPIDLPTALRLANASNPVVAIARERVQQAYFRQRQAEVLWLPTLQAGPAYVRHDGLVQNAIGNVFPTSKWNLFNGGGAVARYDLSDALFAPLITRRLTQAQESEARAVTHNVQLEVALTYFDLLEAYGRLAINRETLANAAYMMKLGDAAEKAGTGMTPADAPRLRTEFYQRNVERRDLEALVGEVSARLAQLLLLRPTVDLAPSESAIVPVQLVPAELGLEDLVQIGLQNRPELVESRSLVDAASYRWRQARTDPLLPRLEVGYYAGSFGGGINSDTIRFGGRGDATVQAVWELHNMGAGDIARTRERLSQVQEANLHVVQISARISAEVVSAVKLVRAHQRTLQDAQKAVKEAFESWDRLRKAAFGFGLPGKRLDAIQPLIAEQQLNAARNLYLAEVISFNKAQVRLYTALGSPALSAQPQAAALSVTTPVLPHPPENKGKE